MTPEEEIAELEAKNTRQREQIAALLEREQELEARLAKDSRTSNKPPASDPLGCKRPRSEQRKSGKKPGGQLGHRGETLPVVSVPDEVVDHRPAVCRRCQTPLDETASVALYERRQVRELPSVRLLVREQWALHVRRPLLPQVSVWPFPAEAPSRVQYGPRPRALAVYLLRQQLIPYARVRELCADLLGAPVLNVNEIRRYFSLSPNTPVSLGTLVRRVRQSAETLRPVEEAIKTALAQAPV